MNVKIKRNDRGFVLSLLKEHGSCGPALAFVQRRWEIVMRQIEAAGEGDARKSRVSYPIVWSVSVSRDIILTLRDLQILVAF